MIISPVNHKAEVNKSALLKVWSVLVIVFIASCTSHPKANIDTFLSMDQVRNTNRNNLARLSVGMGDFSQRAGSADAATLSVSF